ncbi:hypothetical protein D3C86_2056040 [compost metagenome]
MPERNDRSDDCVDQTDSFRDTGIALLQRLIDGLCCLRKGRRRDERRHRHLAQLRPQALLNLLLSQHERTDRDEKFRPGARIQ